MKTFFNSSAPKNSFFKQEQERIESIIKEPLLEYVLQDLPHLQNTTEQQDDVWEIIAIKLNTDQFQSSLTGNDNNNEVDEISTLNGPYIKEVYSKLMSDFTQRVYSMNRYSQVYKTEYTRPPDGSSAPIGYASFSLPIREILTDRIDRILCELFYMKGYDVEVMAKLSRERFEEQRRADYKTKLTTDKDSTKIPDSESLGGRIENEQEDTHSTLQHAKEQQEKLKIDVYEKEFVKKNQKIDQLNKENKRLLELNHELIMELRRLRELSS